MEHISIDKLHFGYTSEEVIKGLDLHVNAGELVTILGENGSGKSTLLKLMLGEYKPRSGTVKLLGKDLHNMTDFKEIGYVPQIQTASLISFPITARELVVLNLYEDFGFLKMPGKKHKEKAADILREMGMGEYINAPVNELSGGLKQRVMIARAMINRPKLIILDEPTAGVDKDNKINFLKLIGAMNRENGITIVIVSHELELINNNLKINKAYKMDEGRLVDVGI